MTWLQTIRRKLAAPAPVNDARWIVLDVESSGLNPKSDRLLAIAAIAVGNAGGQASIRLGDSFEVVLRQDVLVADKANILLHGIGVGAQSQGVAPELALTAFERFIGDSPLIAFHAAFDQTLILRAFDSVLGRRPSNPWLDLEPLAAVLMPKVRARSLDEWMAKLQISCAVRHQAAADTLATAELLQKLWPAAVREMGGKVRFATASRLAAQRNWMPP
jgi:DNA polymerase-3 subunit epsilon